MTRTSLLHSSPNHSFSFPSYIIFFLFILIHFYFFIRHYHLYECFTVYNYWLRTRSLHFFINGCSWDKFFFLPFFITLNATTFAWINGCSCLHQFSAHYFSSLGTLTLHIYLFYSLVGKCIKNKNKLGKLLWLNKHTKLYWIKNWWRSKSLTFLFDCKSRSSWLVVYHHIQITPPLLLSYIIIILPSISYFTRNFQ